MNPTFDHLLVALAILAAAAFFLRGCFGRKKKGCSSGCGCDVAKGLKIKLK